MSWWNLLKVGDAEELSPQSTAVKVAAAINTHQELNSLSLLPQPEFMMANKEQRIIVPVTEGQDANTTAATPLQLSQHGNPTTVWGSGGETAEAAREAQARAEQYNGATSCGAQLKHHNLLCGGEGGDIASSCSSRGGVAGIMGGYRDDDRAADSSSANFDEVDVGTISSLIASLQARSTLTEQEDDGLATTVDEDDEGTIHDFRASSSGIINQSHGSGACSSAGGTHGDLMRRTPPVTGSPYIDAIAASSPPPSSYLDPVLERFRSVIRQRCEDPGEGISTLKDNRFVTARPGSPLSRGDADVQYNGPVGRDHNGGHSTAYTVNMEPAQLPTPVIVGLQGTTNASVQRGTPVSMSGGDGSSHHHRYRSVASSGNMAEMSSNPLGQSSNGMDIGASLSDVATHRLFSQNAQPVHQRGTSNVEWQSTNQRSQSEVSLPAAAATYNGGDAMQEKLDSTGCITVVDPQRRKLQVPLSAIEPTKALKGRLTTPSVCLLYQSGRCRQGHNCYQVHVDPATVERLRIEVDSMPSCCAAHGDSNDHLADFKPTEIPSISIGGQYIVPLTRIAYTAGLCRILQDDRAPISVNPTVLCRLHGQKGGCRFGADCKFLHICCQILNNELRGVMAAAAANAANNSPAAEMHIHTASGIGFHPNFSLSLSSGVGGSLLTPTAGGMSLSTPVVQPLTAAASNSLNGGLAAFARGDAGSPVQLQQSPNMAGLSYGPLNIPPVNGSPRAAELFAGGIFHSSPNCSTSFSGGVSVGTSASFSATRNSQAQISSALLTAPHHSATSMATAPNGMGMGMSLAPASAKLSAAMPVYVMGPPPPPQARTQVSGGGSGGTLQSMPSAAAAAAAMAQQHHDAMMQQQHQQQQQQLLAGGGPYQIHGIGSHLNGKFSPLPPSLAQVASPNGHQVGRPVAHQIQTIQPSSQPYYLQQVNIDGSLTLVQMNLVP